MEKKAAEKKEARALKRQKKGEEGDDSSEAKSGIQIQAEGSSKRRKTVSIGECNDLATLEGMLENPIARGKKQRIRKKIQALKNPQEAAANGSGSKDPKKEKSKEEVRTNAKQKVEQLLRKREEKLLRKEQSKGAASGGKTYQTKEDLDIAKQVKNKKREKRRERVKEEDQFDSLFNKYKKNLMKRLDEEDAGKDKVNGKSKKLKKSG